MNPVSALSRFTRIRFIAERVAELREQASDQLRSVKVASVSPTLALDGTNAEVISESENVIQDQGTVEWYYLTQIVRNEAGEYFLLKTTDAAPYIKHLDQARAKVVLKSMYRAPQPNAAQGDA